ncbi:MAG TPA: 5-formyltetrahydrofolate cyclo-ligase [Alphaproteobacteria bacterium]|nr:5-formyltetrahydrofolate cyclo-ligase [Alphaproteobacteria bacterium]
MDEIVAAARKGERARLLAARGAVDAETHARWSSAISVALRSLLIPFTGRVFGFYWPHRGEYDPVGIATDVIASGGACALPVVVARKQPLVFRVWHPDAAMIPGAYSYGIPHPAEGETVIPDVVLVPLVGFDRLGYRLGYGGGYFDRTLAAITPRPRTIGVGFELGRLATIDPQPHDIALDVIVTEAGIFPTG